VEAPERFQAIQSYRATMAVLRHQANFVKQLFDSSATSCSGAGRAASLRHLSSNVSTAHSLAVLVNTGGHRSCAGMVAADNHAKVHVASARHRQASRACSGGKRTMAGHVDDRALSKM